MWTWPSSRPNRRSLPPVREALNPASPTAPRSGKYPFVFPGQPFAAATLPAVFAQVIDATATVAPEALETLATRRTRARRFISRHPEQVHLRSPNLPMARTGSGWWISTNIGENDLIRALKALCEDAGLEFGKDLVLG